MSFAILRHAKINSSTKGAAVSHNHRLNDVEKININPAQKHLNKLFMGEGAKDRIDAKLPAKFRKDAVVSVEVLLTASPEFFNGLTEDRERLAKNPVFLAWVDESLKWAKKEFGSNLVDLVLHMDESSPHIHVLTVPLIDGRLCAKEVTAKKEMQRRQTEYATAMKQFGLVRGDPAIETKRRHIGLKESPGAGGQASQLAAQLVQKQAELDRVQLEVGSEKANWVMREEFLKSRNEKIRSALVDATEKVKTMDEYTKTLNAELAKKDAQIASELVAKAEAIEALVQAGIKSEALLVTAEGHRAAAEKLTTTVEELEKVIVEKDARIEKYAVMAGAYEAHIDAGLPASEFVPGAMAPEASKSLLERIEEWVKGLVEKFGKKPLGLVEGKGYIGNVLAVLPGGGAWAQKTSSDGSWVVHEGKAPPLGVLAEVKFKGGVSQVKGMDNQFQQQKPGVAR